jgi:hypothetical protein
MVDGALLWAGIWNQPGWGARARPRPASSCQLPATGSWKGLLCSCSYSHATQQPAASSPDLSPSSASASSPSSEAPERPQPQRLRIECAVRRRPGGRRAKRAKRGAARSRSKPFPRHWGLGAGGAFFGARLSTINCNYASTATTKQQHTLRGAKPAVRTTRLWVFGSLASDWLPALAAAPPGAQQSRTFSIGGRFRSIAPACDKR